MAAHPDAKKGYVVINGRHYSAKTGRTIGAQTKVDSVAHHAESEKDSSHSKPKHHHARHQSSTHRRVDGVSRGSHKSKGKTHAHSVHKRKSVSKRQGSAKKVSIHVAQPLITPVVETVGSEPQLQLSSRLTTEREKRARKIQRSDKITKFEFFTAKQEVVQEPPELAPPPPDLLGEHEKMENEARRNILTLSQIAQQNVEVQKEKHAHARKKKRRKLATATATFASVMAVSGYMLYLNMPGLSLRLAAARSGVEVSEPEYKPDGFELSRDIAYRPGFLTFNYSSTKGDGREFKIAQQLSDWDSQSLLENSIRQEGGKYEAHYDRGLTLYVFGSKVVWVNGGTLYMVEGDSLLDKSELLKIAGSL